MTHKAEIKLIRQPTNWNEPTLGRLEFGDKSWATLELPWRNNERNISCIPNGAYPLLARTFGRYFEAYKRRFKHEFALEVSAVQGRGAILIHTGNVIGHTRGCILIGKRHQGNKVMQSRDAYQELYKALAKTQFASKASRFTLRVEQEPYENELDAADNRDLHYEL